MRADDPNARVRGWAQCLYDKGLDPNLDLPVLSKIITVNGGELWLGGAGVWNSRTLPYLLPRDFDYVVQLTKKEVFDIGPNTARKVVDMRDTAEQGFEEVDALATEIARRILLGQKVLVHCQVGMNRSGLVAAAAMVKLGYHPGNAIAHLRASRSPVVLCNPSFEHYIRSLA